MNPYLERLYPWLWSFGVLLGMIVLGLIVQWFLYGVGRRVAARTGEVPVPVAVHRAGAARSAAASARDGHAATAGGYGIHRRCRLDGETQAFDFLGLEGQAGAFWFFGFSRIFRLAARRQ